MLFKLVDKKLFFALDKTKFGHKTRLTLEHT